MIGLKFSEAELRLIKRVIRISIVVSFAVALVAWALLRLNLYLKTSKTRAEQMLEGSREIQPIDIEAHRVVAARYREIDAPQRALPHLRRIHALYKNDDSTTLTLAHTLLEAGRYSEALDLYNLLLDRLHADSITPAHCARRGIALFYLNRIEESREALLSCTDRFADNAEAYCFLGQIEASLDIRSQKATEYFNRAIALDSTYIEPVYQLGRFYMAQKLYTKAREMFQTAIDAAPFHNKSYAGLGMAYYYLEYPELAKKAYNTALMLNPDDYNTRYNLGELYYVVLGDTISALREFKRSLELNGNLFEAAFRIGMICMKNGMTKEAITYYEKALEKNPGDVRILMQCAVAHEKLGRIDKAMETYRSILANDELNMVARQKLNLLGRQ